MNKPRVIILDVRNGQVRADGSNINLPPEGQESALRSIEAADVLVEVHLEGIWVKKGVDEGWVTMISTKSILQMNTEKADQELANRTDGLRDDLKLGEHPVEEKFKRVWEGDSNSGTAELKGF